MSNFKSEISNFRFDTNFASLLIVIAPRSVYLQTIDSIQERSSPLPQAAMNGLKIFQKTESLHEGRWWEPMPDGRVHCYLCPRHCHLGEGQAGFCFIRVNEGGKLYSLGYALAAA